jgi:hypothetical protein
MAVEFDAGGQWERVASELRAYRDYQQQAWGDIDNATLGRYLAGELDFDERHRVETALDERPELRKLTELVRAVLVEFEPGTTPSPRPESVPAAPALLPGSLPSRFARWPARPALVLRLRRRSALVAAACLLLTLGLAMPRPALLSPPPPADGAGLGPGLASLAPNRALRDPAGGATGSVGLAAIGPLDRSVEALQKQGKVRDAEALAEFYAVSLNRVGLFYKEEGDLTRAEPSLSQAHALCAKWLRPENPNTVQVVNNLAGVYRTALNADPGPRAVAAPAAADRAQAQYAYARKTASDLRERITRRTPREVKASVLPVLVQALRHATDSREKLQLARAIGELGPAARDAAPVLAECVSKTRDPQERRTLLLALGQMGTPARAAVPQRARHKGAGQDHFNLAREVLCRIQGCEDRIGVRDECDCFTVAALRDAHRQINDLAKSRGVEVLIETAPTLDARSARRCADRARELGPHAVYVLIGKDGSAVGVGVTEGLRQQGFTADRLCHLLADLFRRKGYDAGLLDGLRFVAEFEQKKGGKK